MRRCVIGVFLRNTKGLCELKLLSNLSELADWRAEHTHSSQPIAFVPTMGNLHSGHLRLVARGKAIEPRPMTVVSIFVNPLQFNDPADLARYPRTLDTDLAQLRSAGVDAVFVPPVEALLPSAEGAVHIDPGVLALPWEGLARPGHFTGMATIVAKLFNLIRPNFALFGEKDFQQLIIVRQMVRDLNFPVTLIGVPTERAADGLALSSRNRFLTHTERELAPLLYAQLSLAAERISRQESVDAVMHAAHRTLQTAGFSLEYLTFCDAHTLHALHEPGPGVLLAAARLGAVRLIDNVQIKR